MTGISEKNKADARSRFGLVAVSVALWSLLVLPIVGPARLLARQFAGPKEKAWRERKLSAIPGTLRIAGGALLPPELHALAWPEVRAMRWYAREWTSGFSPPEVYVLVEIELTDGRLVRTWAPADLATLREVCNAQGFLDAPPEELGREPDLLAEAVGVVLLIGWIVLGLVIFEARR